jgi:hypothetical protein
MLIFDADESWRRYYEYLGELLWNGYISHDDWSLSKKHGKLYKDGKPYTKEKDLSFDSLNELNYKPRSFENKLLDAQYESMVDYYKELLKELRDIEWKPYRGNLTCEQRPYGFKLKNMIRNAKPFTNKSNMESVKVTPPDGYEIDPKSTTSEIFFRKKDNRPRSRKDLSYPVAGFVVRGNVVKPYSIYSINDESKEAWPTKELAEAALALSELMQYRQRWIGDWKPDFKDSTVKYYIRYFADTIDLDSTKIMNYVLTFPSSDMRDDFFKTFKDLLNTAKPLL